MIFVDTETTGLISPEAIDIKLQPYMIEIYACKVSDKWEFIEDIETLIQPPIPIPEFITKLTNIDDKAVNQSPKFVEIYDWLYDFFAGEKTVIAHNCSFDIDIIKLELIRYGLEFKFPWPKKQICTVEASYPIKNRRLKLAELHELATGEPFINNAHRAKADVMALIRSTKWLFEKGFID